MIVLMSFKKSENFGYPINEHILCPQCKTIQPAQIHFEKWMPFPSYFHICCDCGYTITESTWDTVQIEKVSDGNNI